MTSNRGMGPGGASPDEKQAKPHYTLRPVVKPLPSQVSAAPPDAARPLRVRAENEDDDGYDPYSDFHDGTARALEFEDDPWR